MRSVRLRHQLLDDVIEDLVRHVLPCQGLWSCHSMDRHGLRDTAMLQGHEDEQEIATVHEGGRPEPGTIDFLAGLPNMISGEAHLVRNARPLIRARS